MPDAVPGVSLHRWATKRSFAMDGRKASEHVAFRASPQLVAALIERASRAGCSVSEYVRSTIRDRVGLN